MTLSSATLRRPRGRRLSWAALGALGAAYLYAVDPSVPGRYPPCASLTLTHFYCPGCGGLRAAHALLHGDVALSLERNPLVLPLVLLLVGWAVRWWRRGRPTPTVDPAGWRFRVVLAGLAVFWVARNLPGWDWLSPA